MSKEFIVFTEMKYNDKWYCINPSTIVFDPTPHNRIIPTDNYNWSFGKDKTFDKLKEYGHKIAPEEISSNLLNSLDAWGLTAYDLCYVIDEETIFHILAHTEVQKSGFVLKSQIVDYEARKLFDITEYLSNDEYKDLDDEGKKAYQYYEWRERYGWFDDLEVFKKETETQQVYIDIVNGKDYVGDIRLLFFCPNCNA